MAKAPAVKAENEIAVIDEEFEAQLRGDAGKGVSTDAADNLVPMIYVLQPLSPQVVDGPAHIEGARAGDFWLKNATDPIVSSKNGIYFMPACMYMKWTEWIPRDKGGGFVASYPFRRDSLPDGAEQDLKERSRPRFFMGGTGNELVEQRYEAGIVWRDGEAMPYVIPFKSTGLSVSKGWMTKRTSLKRPDGSIWPAWSHLYKLTTELKKNNFGQWYQIKVGDPITYIPGYQKNHQAGLDIIGGDWKAAYEIGRALDQAFETGQKSEDEADYKEESSKPTVKDEIPF